MGQSALAKGWSAAVPSLGAVLLLAHFAHAVSQDGSVPTVVFGVLFPVVVSLGLLVGGVWLWRSDFEPESAKRVTAWCVVGFATVGGGATLMILYQDFHGVVVVDQAFMVVSSGSVGALTGFVVGVYDAQKQCQKRAIRNRERTLSDLHTTTRKLVQTTDREAIASRTVQAARDVLGMPLNACWLYDESEDALVPVATTDEGRDVLGDPPVYSGGDSLSWKAFENGEVMTFDDVQESANLHNPDTSVRSEIVVPLGEHGVMNVGSTEPGAFDHADISLVRILAANTQTALERADRERELATAQDQTERLNRQLSVLNRVLRHDIRNSANVIRGHADVLAEDADGERNPAATVREQAAELVELGEQARDIERMIRDESPDCTVVDIVDVVEAQLEQVRQKYPAVEVREPTTESCRVRAHPRVESAIANVIENAAEHNDRQTPRVEADVSRVEGDRVEVRIADDGPGIPETEVEVLERGYETPLEHTSGLGLWLVSWIVRESDGEIRFEENDPRGSVVCLRFDAASTDE